MAPRFVSITLGPNDDGRRVDRVARRVLPELPLSKVYSAIRSGDIRLNGRRTRGDVRVSDGDTLDTREGLLSAPAVSRLPRRPAGRGTPARERPGAAPPSRTDTAETLEGRIVFQSPHLLVIAKARGELVHGPESLETLVARHLEGSLDAGVSFRPGPVHRLDRNTTGLVVYAASLKGAQEMSRALRAHEVRKVYAAVLQGVVRGEHRWEDQLARDSPERRTTVGPGRNALTIVTPVATAQGRSLVTARIITGRTHQIRAQAEAHGTPLLGDRKYGGGPLSGGYILHAGSLSLSNPAPETGFTHLWTPLPPDAERRVRRMFDDAAIEALYRSLRNAHD